MQTIFGEGSQRGGLRVKQLQALIDESVYGIARIELWSAEGSLGKMQCVWSGVAQQTPQVHDAAQHSAFHWGNGPERVVESGRAEVLYCHEGPSDVKCAVGVPFGGGVVVFYWSRDVSADEANLFAKALFSKLSSVSPLAAPSLAPTPDPLSKLSSGSRPASPSLAPVPAPFSIATSPIRAMDKRRLNKDGGSGIGAAVAASPVARNSAESPPSMEFGAVLPRSCRNCSSSFFASVSDDRGEFCSGECAFSFRFSIARRRNAAKSKVEERDEGRDKTTCEGQQVLTQPGGAVPVAMAYAASPDSRHSRMVPQQAQPVNAGPAKLHGTESAVRLQRAKRIGIPYE